MTIQTLDMRGVCGKNSPNLFGRSETEKAGAIGFEKRMHSDIKNVTYTNQASHVLKNIICRTMDLLSWIWLPIRWAVWKHIERRAVWPHRDLGNIKYAWLDWDTRCSTL